MTLATELEIRKEQRSRLFDLLEIEKANKEENDVLKRSLARHKASMLEEDVALVEKMISQLD